MRKALNENPMVQIGVCAVLLVVVAFLFMTRMGGGKSEEAQNADAAAAVALPAGVSSDGSAASATPAPGAPAPTGATGVTSGGGGITPTPSVPSTSGTTVDASALKPGPGLPAPLVNAWKGGQAVVLLIVKPSAVDDRMVEASVQGLSASNIVVFVTPADEIARYSRVTQGVGVNRVPALVVIRPKSASKVPEAIVSYGFRDSQSVIQAVEDAVYTGRDNLPYHPG